MKKHLQTTFLCSLLCCTIAFAQTPDANGVVYVKAGSSGTLGSSWATAIPELATALYAAKSNTAIKQIWVAAGTYKPKCDPRDGYNSCINGGRDNSFRMINGVKVYGGFSGTNETSIAQRNWLTNVTILSGDVNGDDVFTGSGSSLVISNNADNNYHVVVGNGCTSSTVLDGVVITGGNATAIGNLQVGIFIYRSWGGGIYLNNSPSMIIANVVLKANVAEVGAGILNTSGSSPLLYNSEFSFNHATAGGSGMYNLGGSSPNVVNVLFKANKTSYYTVANEDGSPNFVNITISGNHADAGAAFYSLTNAGVSAASSPKIYNSIIYGNTPVMSGIDHSGAGFTSRNRSMVSQLPADVPNGNLDGNADPLFVNAATGNFNLQNTSPLLGKGSDASYNAITGAPTTDLAGNNRFNGTIDVGAYENTSTLPVTLVEFTAKLQQNVAVISWETVAESNNSHFVIQHSADGVNFREVAQISPKGISGGRYYHTHYNLADGTNYYTLLQVDRDGTTTNYGTKVVKLPTKNALSVYPNPVEKDVEVSFEAGIYQTLLITDMSGRVKERKEISLLDHTIKINMNNYVSGLYVLKLSGKNGTKTQKIIKQ